MSMLSFLGWLFFAFFIVYLLCKLLGILWRIFYPYLLARPKDLRKLAGEENRWAVVTGSTDGIGKAYAFELASKGFHIALVSRTQSKLETVAKEIQGKYPQVITRCIQFDFRTADQIEYERKLFYKIDDLEIGILVNNVGIFYKGPKHFHTADGGIEGMRDQVVVNCVPVTILTAFVLKQMSIRGKGIIVNIASIAGFTPTYYYAVYAASKAFTRFLTAALQMEYPKGIVIQSLCPGAIQTQIVKEFFEGKSKPTLSFLTPEQFVKQAIHTIGVVKETAGCMGHQFETEMYLMLPSFAKKFMMKKTIQTYL